ncbi:MAG: type I toxin-antitoxin system Fst family toxin [Streptococcaceae bacterium]|nr:type I toxin-antitoxin system Fst family toxin [Streptococcaceae bacterium]
MFEQLISLFVVAPVVTGVAIAIFDYWLNNRDDK